jgi:hypothetical protein
VTLYLRPTSASGCIGADGVQLLPCSRAERATRGLDRRCNICKHRLCVVRSVNLTKNAPARLSEESALIIGLSARAVSAATVRRFRFAGGKVRLDPLAYSGVPTS